MQIKSKCQSDNVLIRDTYIIKIIGMTFDSNKHTRIKYTPKIKKVKVTLIRLNVVKFLALTEYVPERKKKQGKLQPT